MWACRCDRSISRSWHQILTNQTILFVFIHHGRSSCEWLVFDGKASAIYLMNAVATYWYGSPCIVGSPWFTMLDLSKKPQPFHAIAIVIAVVQWPGLWWLLLWLLWPLLCLVMFPAVVQLIMLAAVPAGTRDPRRGNEGHDGTRSRNTIDICTVGECQWWRCA